MFDGQMTFKIIPITFEFIPNELPGIPVNDFGLLK